MSVLRIRARSRSQLVSIAGGACLVLLAAGCQRSSQNPEAAAPPPPAAQEQLAETPEGEAAGQPSEQAAAPAAPPAPVRVAEVGFKTPEAVLHDAEQDVYLVSNINGGPTELDGNGFISKLGPDGKVIELKWIDGTQPDVHLNAPKGMAIAGDKLYVADVTFVRIFDRKSGKPLGKIGAGGASFLNGVAAAPDGTVYVSDSGLKAGKEGLEPNGTDAIYRIGSRGMAERVIAGPELNRPNGLVADDAGVWVVSYGSAELYRVTVTGNEGKKEKVQNLPSGGLDGLVQLPDGSVLVSSWAGSAVYRGVPGGAFTQLVKDVKSPAAIGYDQKRNTLLIPLFEGDAVQLQSFGPPQKTPAQPGSSGAAPAKAQPAAQPKAQPAAQPKAPAAGPATPAKPSASPATQPKAGAAEPAKPAPAAQPKAAPAQPPKAAPAPPGKPSPDKAASDKAASDKAAAPTAPQPAAAQPKQ